MALHFVQKSAKLLALQQSFGAADPPEGAIQNAISGKCIDLPGGNTDAGTALWLWDCPAGGEALDGQKWRWENDNIVYVPDTSKCISVIGQEVIQNIGLELQNCDGGSYQKFGYDDKMLTIWAATIDPNVNKCLQVSTRTPNNGAKPVFWNCFGSDNQQWILGAPAPPPGPPPVPVHGVQNKANGMCLELPEPKTQGTYLEVQKCDTSKSGKETQQWAFDNNGHLVWLGDITMCVDVPANILDNDNQLEIWPCDSGYPQQLWGYDSGSNTIYLASSQSDASKCMHLKSGSMDAGTPVVIYDCNGEDQQIWYLETPPPTPPPSPPRPGPTPSPPAPGPRPGPHPGPSPGPTPPVAHAITSRASGKCWTMPGGDVGGRVEAWPCTGDASQNWKFTDDGKIQYLGDQQYCLDLANNDQKNGNPIAIWYCSSGGDQQQWGWDSNYGTIYLSKSDDATKCVDLTNAGQYDGDFLQIWDCNGYPQQQFDVAASAMLI